MCVCVCVFVSMSKSFGTIAEIPRHYLNHAGACHKDPASLDSHWQDFWHPLCAGSVLADR